jgi:predicted transcriptional regulator
MTDQALSEPETTSVSLTSGIVAAYVAHNSVPRTELTTLIADVHAAIERLRAPSSTEEQEKPSPSVPIRRSVTADYIVCLEDGRKFKSLKRHLSTRYGLTPDAYRAKWGLPSTYPMVAPNYAAARSALAKDMGLGRKRAQPAAAPKAAAAKPGRKRARS